MMYALQHICCTYRIESVSLLVQLSMTLSCDSRHHCRSCSTIVKHSDHQPVTQQQFKIATQILRNWAASSSRPASYVVLVRLDMAAEPCRDTMEGRKACSSGCTMNTTWASTRMAVGACGVALAFFLLAGRRSRWAGPLRQLPAALHAHSSCSRTHRELILSILPALSLQQHCPVHTKHCPMLPALLWLSDTLANLRRLIKQALAGRLYRALEGIPSVAACWQTKPQYQGSQAAGSGRHVCASAIKYC